jgi:hypothetical protein
MPGAILDLYKHGDGYGHLQEEVSLGFIGRGVVRWFSIGCVSFHIPSLVVLVVM